MFPICPSPVGYLDSNRLLACMICRVQKRLRSVLHPVLIHGPDKRIVLRRPQLHGGMVVRLLDLRLPRCRALFLLCWQLAAAIQTPCEHTRQCQHTLSLAAACLDCFAAAVTVSMFVGLQRASNRQKATLAPPPPLYHGKRRDAHGDNLAPRI